MSLEPEWVHLNLQDGLKKALVEIEQLTADLSLANDAWNACVEEIERLTALQIATAARAEQAQIELAAERERCAKFIEGQGNAIGHLMASHLAEQIRKGES